MVFKVLVIVAMLSLCVSFIDAAEQYWSYHGEYGKEIVWTER